MNNSLDHRDRQRTLGMKIPFYEVAKIFKRLADAALVEPVTITKDGRDYLVLLTADEYARLKSRDRQVYRAGEVPTELLAAIEATEPPPEAEAVQAKLIDRSSADLAMKEIVKISEDLGLYGDPKPMPPKSTYRSK